jgi:hypothetical protein
MRDGAPIGDRVGSSEADLQLVVEAS